MRKLPLLLLLLAFPTAAQARPHGEIVTTANTFQLAGVFEADGTGEVFWPGMIVGDVATGDVNGDGTDEIVLGSGRGGGARVRVLDGITRATLMDFSPQKDAPAGVRVAAGDLTGDGHADIATAPATGEGPVRVYDGVGGGLVRTFYPYGHRGSDGISIALGDLTGDGHAEIVTGPASPSGTSTLVKAFDGVTNAMIRSFVAVEQEWGGGVDVATGHVSGNSREDIVVVAASGPYCLMEFWDEGGLDFHISLGKRFPCHIRRVDVGNIDLDIANEVVFGDSYGPPAKVSMFDDSILMMQPFQPFPNWAFEGNGVAVQTIK